MITAGHPIQDLKIAIPVLPRPNFGSVLCYDTLRSFAGGSRSTSELGAVFFPDSSPNIRFMALSCARRLISSIYPCVEAVLQFDFSSEVGSFEGYPLSKV